MAKFRPGDEVQITYGINKGAKAYVSSIEIFASRLIHLIRIEGEKDVLAYYEDELEHTT